MALRSYQVPGLVLSPSNEFSAQVKDLQQDLRALGYLPGPLDGMFGAGTQKAINALQFDLMNNHGASTGNDGAAPVGITSYNGGAVTAQTGVLDQGLAGVIASMLADANYPQLPASANPAADNHAALQSIGGMAGSPVPVPYLLAILAQESGLEHFRLADSYVTIGLDRNNAANPAAITSRGYGIGQYTLFHHPPTAEEMATFITDPVSNVKQAVAGLQDKFDNYVLGDTPAAQASDRIAEHGAAPLRACVYPPGDPRYLTDCKHCMVVATLVNITAGVTPVYAGAGMDYAQTQYHAGSYANVPVRANIPCDWPYAARRYNGSGVNSYDYQAEVLKRVANG